MSISLRALTRNYVLLVLAVILPIRASAQAIIDAVKRNDIAAVREMLQANPRSVGATDGDGATPLSWAANKGGLDMVRLLIQNGAKVNQRQNNGWTPVCSAVAANQETALRLLYDNGADLDPRTIEGYCPIHIAASSGCYSSLVFLAAAGVDVNSQATNGDTPLAYAARNGQMQVGRLLIALGGDPNVRNKDGRTALDEATRLGKTDFAGMLAAYQQALEERGARDIARKTSGLNLRPSFASWTDPKTVTKTVYRTDFSADPGQEWRSTPLEANVGALRISTTPAGARRFLGDFGNQAIVLTLADLPSHKEVAIIFDLFIIRSMDGNLPDIGPDIWSLGIVDGPTLIRTTFFNLRYGISPALKLQAYPGEYPGANNAPYTGALETNSLGYRYGQGIQSMPADSVYRLRFTFVNHSRTILFRFAANNLQDLGDESWGIANVHVAVGVAPPVPAPSAVHVTPKTRATVSATLRRTMVDHRPAPRLATRVGIRKAKPTRMQSKPPVKRIHDKKQAPKP